MLPEVAGVLVLPPAAEGVVEEAERVEVVVPAEFGGARGGKLELGGFVAGESGVTCWEVLAVAYTPWPFLHSPGGRQNGHEQAATRPTGRKNSTHQVDLRD